MPLMKGSSKEIIGENIRIQRGEGIPEKQAIAIAYSKAGRSSYRAAGSPGVSFASGGL